jgi:predicted metal-dependent enzyme (double-stranded beta helix superfamily)
MRAGAATLVRQDKLWEVFGVLRGSISRSYPSQAGVAFGAPGTEKVCDRGSVYAATSVNGESAVQLSNTLDEGLSIAIHVYGGDVGALTRYAHKTGDAGDFVSNFANAEDAPAYDIWSIQTKICD